MDWDLQCENCGTHFVLSPGNTLDGAVTNGLACENCGGKRFYRNQPSPTESDGTLRDMVDSDTQKDQGGNPLGEGTIMGDDGEQSMFADSHGRDNYMHSHVAGWGLGPSPDDFPGPDRDRPEHSYAECPACGSEGGIEPSTNPKIPYWSCINCGTKFEPPQTDRIDWEHPDPWMDNEPGSLTIPKHWGHKSVAVDRSLDMEPYEMDGLFDLPADYRSLPYRQRREAGLFDTIKNVGEGLVTHPTRFIPGLAEEAAGTVGDFVPGVDLGPSEALQAEGLATLGEEAAGSVAQDAGQSLVQKGLDAAKSHGVSTLKNQAMNQVKQKLLPAGGVAGLMKGALGMGAAGAGGAAAGGAGIQSVPGAPGTSPSAAEEGTGIQTVQPGQWYGSADLPMMLVADLETSDSIKSVGEQHGDDPEKVDQKEFNDRDKNPSNHQNPNNEDSGASGEDGVREKTEGYGFGPNSPAIDRAFMLLPLILHYFQSEESGENDPLIKGLHDMLEQENPGYLQNQHPEGHQMVQEIIKLHKPHPGEEQQHHERAAGVNMQAPGGMIPQQWSNPAPQAMQNTQGVAASRCPNCGGVTTPGAPCPQCGANADAGQRQANEVATDQSPWSQAADSWMDTFMDPRNNKIVDPYSRRQIHELAQSHYTSGPVNRQSIGNWPESYKQAWINMKGYGGADDIHNAVASGGPTAVDFGGAESYQHPDPWMDNEPGTLTIPQHWGRMANQVGPQTPEQKSVVVQYLIDHGRANEAPNVDLDPNNPEYVKILNEIQRKPNVPPMPDPSQITPLVPQPSSPGAMPMPDPGAAAGPASGAPLQPMSSLEALVWPLDQLHTAADSVAPRCPKCNSGSTTTRQGQEGISFECNSCHNIWERKDVDTIKYKGAKQAADAVAPRCPKCNSGSTGTRQGQEGITFECHSCHHLWEDKNVDTIKYKGGSFHIEGLVDVPNPNLQRDDSYMAWKDTTGRDLAENQEYEISSAAFNAPTYATVLKVHPDHLDMKVSGGVAAMLNPDENSPDFQIKRKEAQLDDYQFTPVNNPQSDMDDRNTEPPQGSTPGVEHIPEQAPTTDEMANSFPNTTVSSVDEDEPEEPDHCTKCGSAMLDSSMRDENTTLYQCVPCGHAWEIHDTFQGKEAGVDLSWLLSGDSQGDDFWAGYDRAQAMQESGTQSRNLSDIVARDSRYQEIHERLTANAMTREAGKHYSPGEKRALINEKGRARNLEDLNLEGTHYDIREDFSGKANGLNVREDDLFLGL